MGLHCINPSAIDLYLLKSILQPQNRIQKTFYNRQTWLLADVTVVVFYLLTVLVRHVIGGAEKAAKTSSVDVNWVSRGEVIDCPLA